MDKMTCQMTVLFEGAFWVGIFEKTESEKSTKRGQKTIAACWHRDEVATGVKFTA